MEVVDQCRAPKTDHLQAHTVSYCKLEDCLFPALGLRLKMSFIAFLVIIVVLFICLFISLLKWFMQSLFLPSNVLLCPERNRGREAHGSIKSWQQTWISFKDQHKHFNQELKPNNHISDSILAKPFKKGQILKREKRTDFMQGHS